MDEFLKIYNECLNRTYQNKELEPLLNSLYDLISYTEDWLLKYELDVIDKRRVDVINEVIPIFKKIIDNNLSDGFNDIIYLYLSVRMDITTFPYFINLIYFYDECFNEYKGKDNNYIKDKNEWYLYALDTLTVQDYNYFRYQQYPIINYIIIAFEYLKFYNSECNIYIPIIILYCFINKFDKDKYLKMLDYAFKHYEELNDFINLHDDYKHEYELYELAIQRIISNYDFDIGSIK